MTDGGPAPGWWLASDGRWYPPSSHPDAAHRARWASVADPSLAVSEQPTEGIPTIPEGSSPPAHVQSAGALPGAPASVPVPPVARPPADWPVTPTPGPPPRPHQGVGNVAAAVVASLAALLACVGTALTWVTVDADVLRLERSGWHVGSVGKAALVAGLVAAGAAGVLWTGLRHLVLKVVLGVAAIVLLVAFVVELDDVLELRDRFDAVAVDASVTVGIGLWMVLAAGVLLAVAAALERSRIRIPRR